MPKTQMQAGPECLVLSAQPATALMTPNPVSIRSDATVAEATTLLTNKGLSAMPVINEAGQAIGVLSKTDILVHDKGEIRKPDAMRVRDLMTPAVFSVSADTPADKVVEQMLALKVHRLFVVDGSGALIGVITALDILRRLHRPLQPAVP